MKGVVIGTHRKRLSNSAFLLFALGLLSAGAGAQNWLPGAPLGSYIGPAVSVNQEVSVGGMKIGHVEFGYNVFQTTPVQGISSGGVGIGGAFLFDMNSLLRLKDGHEFAWVQIVRATLAGPNEWGLSEIKPDPKKPPFPDTNNERTSPSYTINRVDQPDGGDDPNIGFADTPTRVSAKPLQVTPDYDGNQTWDAELGLVCMDADAMSAHVIATLTYGFKVVPPVLGGGFPPDVLADGKFEAVKPSNLGAPSQTYMMTLTNAFTGNNVPNTDLETTKWTFDNDPMACFMMIPEPATTAQVGLLTLLLFLGGGRRRRRNARFPAAVLVALVSLSSLANPCAAQVKTHGRYLPDPLKINEAKDVAYTGNLKDDFNHTIYLGPGNTNPIGEIKFTYDTWKATADLNGRDVAAGGGFLAGGFFFDSNMFALAEDVEMDWVQIVKATIPGSKGVELWKAKPNEWYPDTLDKTGPGYPFKTLPVDPKTLKQPSVAFEDRPTRFPEDGNQTWDAILGLVCKKNATGEICVFATFEWGFGVKGPDKDNKIPDPYITPVAPKNFSLNFDDPYLKTLKANFTNSPNNDLSNYTFIKDCKDCFVKVPELGSSLQVALLAGAALLWGLRRRRR